MKLYWLPCLAAIPQLSETIQPSAREPVDNQKFRELKWGELNFLHTTDNHGWYGGHLQEPQYSADLGDYVSFISHMRQRANDLGVDLLVVDSGDRAEGNGLWDASDLEGYYTRRLLQQVDYDLLTIGNHELYNGTTAYYEHVELVQYFGDRYLSSNVDINITGEWEPLASRTVKLTTDNLGLQITAFGFLFNFTGNYKNTRVKPVATVLEEGWFLDAIADTSVDLFLVVAHIDARTLELQQIHDAIRAVRPETPIQLFAGHSHIRDFKIFDEKSTALESGRYSETVGFLSLSGLSAFNALKAKDGGPLSTSRHYIDFNRAGFQYHLNFTASAFDTPEGLSLSLQIRHYRQALGLNRLIGCAPQDFTLYKDPYPGPNNWYSFLVEKLLPEMVHNPDRVEVPHVIFINGGSQRFDVFRGPFTYDTSFLVSPFTSRFLYAKEVPYEIASQLLEYFLNDASPYSAAAQAKGDLPPLDDHANYAPPKLHSTTHQARLGGRLRKKFAKIQGYTTSDDAGETGDDTVHSHFNTYPLPKVVQSNASFPRSGAEPEVVDVVFFDFIAENVAAGLNTAAGEERYGVEDFDRYMGEEDTLTKLILEYVGRHWSHDC